MYKINFKTWRFVYTMGDNVLESAIFKILKLKVMFTNDLVMAYNKVRNKQHRARAKNIFPKC